MRPAMLSIQSAVGFAVGCDDGVKQAIATKLIALAKTAERNPDILCEQAMKDIRTPQQWAASQRARSFVLEEQEPPS